SQSETQTPRGNEARPRFNAAAQRSSIPSTDRARRSEVGCIYDRASERSRLTLLACPTPIGLGCRRQHWRIPAETGVIRRGQLSEVDPTIAGLPDSSQGDPKRS